MRHPEQDRRTELTSARVLRLRLPEAPATNRYFRIYRNRAVKSSEATAYNTLALAAFREQTSLGQRAHFPLSGAEQEGAE